MKSLPDRPESVADVGPLLQAARTGSPESLGQLMESCRHYLLLVANEELHSDLQAKVAPSDLVQDTFLEAQRDFGQFRGGTQADLRFWLRRILLHNLANCRRQFHATEKRQVSREVALDAVRGDQPGHDPPAATRSPSSQAAAQEQAVALERALEQLPEHYRQAIVLRHREDRSFAAIGQLLDCTPEAARKLWARAIVLLKEALGPSA